MREHAPRFLIPRLGLLLVVVLVVACGGGDPTAPTDPWGGIEVDFLEACAAADTTADPVARDHYCGCVFSEVTEFYGTADAFTAAGLDRDEFPTPDSDTLDPLLVPAFAGCGALHLR